MQDKIEALFRHFLSFSSYNFSMTGPLSEQLSEIGREDIIWGVYIFVAVFAILSNQIEKDYLFSHDVKKYRDFHNINTVLLTIGLLVYIYFFINASNKFAKEKDKSNYLTVVATTLFLIGGAILLYLEWEGFDEPDIL